VWNWLHASARPRLRWWVACSGSAHGCGGWVHLECFDLTSAEREEALTVDNWVCPWCRGALVNVPAAMAVARARSEEALREIEAAAAAQDEGMMEEYEAELPATTPARRGRPPGSGALKGKLGSKAAAAAAAAAKKGGRGRPGGSKTPMKGKGAAKVGRARGLCSARGAHLFDLAFAPLLRRRRRTPLRGTRASRETRYVSVAHRARLCRRVGRVRAAGVELAGSGASALRQCCRVLARSCAPRRWCSSHLRLCVRVQLLPSNRGALGLRDTARKRFVSRAAGGALRCCARLSGKRRVASSRRLRRYVCRRVAPAVAVTLRTARCGRPLPTRWRRACQRAALLLTHPRARVSLLQLRGERARRGHGGGV
jgi:hypothetical protein